MNIVATSGVPPASFVDLRPDSWTRPFWEAAADHRLVCARCTACGNFRSPPSPFCPSCQSQQIEWVELSGLAEVFTFTVVRRALIQSLADAVPFVLAVVALPDADRVRLATNLVDVNPDAVRIGMPVRVVWADLETGVTIPHFAPLRVCDGGTDTYVNDREVTA